MAGAGGGGAAGTPWWLTLLLMAASAALGHLLAVRREKEKYEKDAISRWRDEARVLVQRISDAAIEHYVDASFVAKTPVSAALIISHIRRLRQLIGETVCLDAADAKPTRDALDDFDDAITGGEEFQDEQRAPLGPHHEICQRIRASETQVLISVARPRRRR